MKAEMLPGGIIKLIPESHIEAYALKAWREEASMTLQDKGGSVHGVIDSAMLIIWTRFEEIPQEAG